MTWKPRAASCSQKSSSQLIIWAPRPITSRSGASFGSPNVSYSMSIPLARALGMRQSYDLPEMIAIGFPKLREWVVASPRLAHLSHYLDRLERLQAHLRSPEVEEILTQVSDPLASAVSAHSVLANADMKFPPAIGAEGPEEVAQGTIGSLLNHPDPSIRRTAH